MTEYGAKDIIIEYLNDFNKSISLFKLKNATRLKKYSSNDIDDALSQLLTLGQIIYTPEGISLCPKTLSNMIDQIKNEDIRLAVHRYFNGIKDVGITSSEIKVIIRSFLKNRPVIDEDKYKKIFRSYKFDLNSFTTIFSEATSTYFYLKEVCKKGRQDWREIRYDITQPQSLRNAVIELIKTEGIRVGDETIGFSPEEVSMKLLKDIKSSISIYDFFKSYLEFITLIQPIPVGLVINHPRFFKMMLSQEHIIWGKGKYLRYRQSNKTKDYRLFNRLKLRSYNNQYISSDIIFISYKEIISEYDILNSYELYNLLKKYPDITDKYRIQYSTPPFLRFGNGDAKKQLIDLLKKSSPISGNDLVQKYEQIYGMKVNSTRNTLLPEVSHFLRDGMYDTTTRSLTDKQFEKLSNELSNPWYFTYEVEKLFKRKVGKLYKEYMSKENLKKLGYKITSSIIYSDKYKSLFNCLDKTIWKNNTFHVSDDIWNISQVQISLSQKVAVFDIIEYSPQRFIRISSLKKNGIHKKHLNEFIDIINRYVDDESYFTLKSLRYNGFKIPLDELGFEETFYYSILKQSKKIQSRKVANTYLFRKSKKDATMQDFIEYLVSQLRSIDIYDLINLLYENYGIAISPSYLRTFLFDTQMYYDLISEKIYLDYDEYFEEV
ncbi:hypothetical protein ACHAL6_15025 [Proteiniclasticum sp. C24MP]|uniref:hypothetical protein n=1 Tax=Proteiniclasticum sp. C24MP TaxID=3374101 RepID=UPI0037543AC7